MCIHCHVIFRKLLEEIYQSGNIREYFDSGLYHGCNLLQIQRLANRCLQVRLCHLIELVEIHSLQIFTIHPTQFHDIEDCRGFADAMVIELLDQFIQRENLAVILRAPSKQCHIVHDGFGNESLIDQILEGSMSASLGQLLVVLIGDQRQMDIYRYLPSESFVQTYIFWGGGQIFVASYHMGDIHGMVIYHVCKVIGRVTVGFDQDHIIQLGVIYCNVSV